MTIYDRIKMKRVELGLTQEELAKKSGYTSRSTINKIEAGLIDLPESKITAIANALNVTEAFLMGWEEEPFYINPKTAKLAQQAYEDPDTRILLSAKRTLSPESMQAVIDMVKLLKKKENPQDHPEDFADEEYPEDFNQEPEDWD